MRLKVRFEADFFISTKKNYFSFCNLDQFLNYFLPTTFQYSLVQKHEKADICIVDVQTIHPLNPTEFNIYISVENPDKFKWCDHHTKWGNYGDPTVDIYYYNHISSFCETEDYLSIPTLHTYIRYFKNNTPAPLSLNKISHRKFGLITNRSNLNPDIIKYKEIINKMGYNFDNISIYSDKIMGKSCYHSPELIEVLSNYKFVLCFENSYTNGYITEKIFNCFFAGIIPLYLGAPDITKYINPNCFVDMTKPNWPELLVKLEKDPEEYLKMVNHPKFVENYDDHNFMKKVETRLYNFLEDNAMNKFPLDGWTYLPGKALPGYLIKKVNPNNILYEITNMHNCVAFTEDGELKYYYNIKELIDQESGGIYVKDTQIIKDSWGSVWEFLPQKDIIGYDLFNKKDEELFKVANKTKEINCFNNLGYFKNCNKLFMTKNMNWPKNQGIFIALHKN